MYNFTNSPFEKMMKQTPRGYREPIATPPPGSPCRGCTIWRGMACLGRCHRQNIPKKEEVTSGQLDPKSLPKQNEQTPGATS